MVIDVDGQNDLLGPESVRAQLNSAGVLVQRRSVRASMKPSKQSRCSSFESNITKTTAQKILQSWPKLYVADSYHKLIR